jgi:hypothetical protein
VRSIRYTFDKHHVAAVEPGFHAVAVDNEDAVRPAADA